MALADEVRRAILGRVGALEEQLQGLRGSLGTSRPDLAKGLELFEFFPVAVREVVDKEWATAHPTSRVLVLRPILAHLMQAATFVESWMSHGDRVDLSLDLHRSISRECELLDITGHHVIVANGPADNFFTYPGDITADLFAPLGSFSPMLPDSLKDEKFALMQVPRLQGADVMMRPVVIGHETAHLAELKHSSVAGMDLAAALAADPPTYPVPQAITDLTGSVQLAGEDLGEMDPRTPM